MRLSLKGWLRLGIVLSLSWLLCAVAIVAADYFSARAQSNPPLSSLPPPPPNGFELIRNESAFTLCTLDRADNPTCTLKTERALALGLVPISVVWLFVTLLVTAIRWIGAEFRGIETSTKTRGKLGGPVRLALVFTVVWGVSVISLAAYERIVTIGNTSGPWALYSHYGSLIFYRTIIQNDHFFFWLQAQKFYTTLFLPPVVAWLFALGLVPAWGWVRQGFRT